MWGTSEKVGYASPMPPLNWAHAVLECSQVGPEPNPFFSGN